MDKTTKGETTSRNYDHPKHQHDRLTKNKQMNHTSHTKQQANQTTRIIQRRDCHEGIQQHENSCPTDTDDMQMRHNCCTGPYQTTWHHEHRGKEDILDGPRRNNQWQKKKTTHWGPTRLLQVLLSKSAYLTWVLRCERVIQEKSLSEGGIRVRSATEMAPSTQRHQRLTIDRKL